MATDQKSPGIYDWLFEKRHRRFCLRSCNVFNVRESEMTLLCPFVCWHEQVIWSYQPDPLSTMAFFAMAALGAVSLLATWLLGLTALGVTGVYVVAKAAETAQVCEGKLRRPYIYFCVVVVVVGRRRRCGDGDDTQKCRTRLKPPHRRAW